MVKYKHSEVFAEVKAIKEDIAINLTSLQYLQILDYYLHNALKLLKQVSPEFFNAYLAKLIAYQQIHAMSKLSSESREKISCLFFNYITTEDEQHFKSFFLNRGLYFGILSYWLNKSRVYFKTRDIFAEQQVDSEFAQNCVNELCIKDMDTYFAYFKAIEYWFNHALDFKSKIVQKYVRMTLLQAQKSYVDYNHAVDLDDVTQIYLGVMSKAIDRCDSRLGVLTTFIQSWLKSAQAAVQKQASMKHNNHSYEAMVEEFGDCINLGTASLDSSYEAIQNIAQITSNFDVTGCVRLLYKIPQYVTSADKQLLKEYAL